MLDRHLHLWRAPDAHGKEHQVDDLPETPIPEFRPADLFAQREADPPVSEHKPQPWARTLRMLPGRRGGRR